MKNESIKGMNKADKIKRIKRKKKTILLSIGIIITILIVCIVLFVLKEANVIGKNKNESSGVAQSITENSDEQKKKKAIDEALNKFRELGENVNENELEVMKIKRKNEYYYYISSKQNTVEVRLSDNKITRVNSILVEKW